MCLLLHPGGVEGALSGLVAGAVQLVAVVDNCDEDWGLRETKNGQIYAHLWSVVTTEEDIMQQKEYKENIRHSCGCVREVTTLGYKIPRRQATIMRQNLCPKCQLTALLKP